MIKNAFTDFGGLSDDVAKQLSAQVKTSVIPKAPGKKRERRGNVVLLPGLC